MGLAPDFEKGVGTLDLLDFSDATADEWDGTEWGAGTWAEPKGLIAKQRRISERGTTFSVYVENRELDQSFSLHRLEHFVPEVRDPAKGAS